MPDLATLAELKLALNRLLEGKPVRTKNDGKISLFRINNEAGLSKGHIYYYEDFVSEALIEIGLYEQNKRKSGLKADLHAHDSTVEKLRAERDHEAKLKVKYKKERDAQKLLCEEIVKTNISLMFRLHELETENLMYAQGRILPLKKV